MENVEGLLTSDNGKYIYETTRALIEIGYLIRIEKIYAHEYGVPQRRKRVLIIGNRLGIEFQMPEPKLHIRGKIFRNSDINLRHAIQGLPPATTSKEELLYYDKYTQSLWEDNIRDGANYVSEHYYSKLGVIQQERISMLQPGQTMKDLPEYLQHESFKKRAHRRVMDGTPTEKRGGSPSGLKRLIFDEPCLTITGAATRELVHPHENRPLTIREAARIQTFPDSFQFLGNSSEKVQQIGNAIPPLIAQIFAEHIKEGYGFNFNLRKNRGGLLSYALTKADAMSPALKNTHCLLSILKNKEIEQKEFSYST